MLNYDLFIHELCKLFDEHSVNQGFYTKNDRYFIADLVFWYNHMPFVIIERKKELHIISQIIKIIWR